MSTFDDASRDRRPVTLLTMDREYGARDALAFIRRSDFAPSSVAFDAAFQGER